MSPDNDIAPLSRPPRDLLEMWQEIHRDDWKALLRPKPFEMDYTPPSPEPQSAVTELPQEALK